MIKVSGIREVQNQLKRQMAEQSKTAKKVVKEKLLHALKEATPVDTGFAKESWRSTADGIVNDAPYIEELNQGSSKQAPLHFIEQTVLSQPNVVPDGMIVKYD